MDLNQNIPQPGPRWSSQPSSIQLWGLMTPLQMTKTLFIKAVLTIPSTNVFKVF